MMMIGKRAIGGTEQVEAEADDQHMQTADHIVLGPALCAVNCVMIFLKQQNAQNWDEQLPRPRNLISDSTVYAVLVCLSISISASFPPVAVCVVSRCLLVCVRSANSRNTQNQSKSKREFFAKFFSFFFCCCSLAIDSFFSANCSLPLVLSFTLPIADRFEWCLGSPIFRLESRSGEILLPNVVQRPFHRKHMLRSDAVSHSPRFYFDRSNWLLPHSSYSNQSVIDLVRVWWTVTVFSIFTISTNTVSVTKGECISRNLALNFGTAISVVGPLQWRIFLLTERSAHNRIV